MLLLRGNGEAPRKEGRARQRGDTEELVEEGKALEDGEELGEMEGHKK
jgi:hypothetical protein